MRGIVKAVAMGFGLTAAAALVSAPAFSKDDVKYRTYRQNPAAWYWFGPPGRGEHIAPEAPHRPARLLYRAALPL